MPDERNPRMVTGAPVRGADLYARDAVIDGIWTALAHGNVLLTGPRRHGKTSVMYALVDAPRAGWVTSIADVEYIEDPTDLLETVLAALLANRPVRNALNALRSLPGALLRWTKSAIEQLELQSQTLGQVRLQLRESRPSGAWEDLGALVSQAISSLPPDSHYLIVLDEFPIFLNEFMKKDLADATRFLRWFRATRQGFSNTRFLVGGSVNLEATLSGLGLTSLINDFEIVRLRPFPDHVALAFLRELLPSARGHDLQLVAPHIQKRIGLGVPFYLQLLAAHVRDAVVIDGMEASAETVEFVYQDRLLGPDCRSRFDHYRSRLGDYYKGEDELRARIILHNLCDNQWHRDTELVKALVEADLDSGNGEATEFVMLALEADYYVERRDGKARFLHSVLGDWWRMNIRTKGKRQS